MASACTYTYDLSPLQTPGAQHGEHPWRELEGRACSNVHIDAISPLGETPGQKGHPRKGILSTLPRHKHHIDMEQHE